MQDKTQLSLMSIIMINEQARLNHYDKCQDYYEGNQPLKVPEKYKKIIETEYNIKANYCKPIIEAPVSRLKVEGIKCEDKVVNKFLTDIWDNNRMDAKSIKFHRNAVKKGDSFAQVWPKFIHGTDKPIGYEIKFLRPDIVFPMYQSDDDESLAWVKKQWLTFDLDGLPMARKDIFYHDRIERYVATVSHYMGALSLGGYAMLQWQGYNQDGFEPILKNPYGIIPIVHFKNREDDCPFGTTELEDAFTLQDGINKLIIDLMRTSDFQAFKQRYISGADEDSFEIDEKTGKRTVQSNPGDVWLLPEESKVGDLEAADPKGILESIDKLIDLLAEVTRTPRNILQDSAGSASSGFALQKVEQPLIDKVQEMQISFGNSYEDINKILMTMGIHHKEIAKIEKTETIWKELTQTSPADKLTIAQERQVKKQNKVISAAEWQRLEGYTEEEIDNINAEIAAETELATADTLGDSFANVT
ncbi:MULTISPECIES: phage portal protein [Pelosinus]|uniref:Bacteriophage portal protein, SPP1 Gp6-like protein n=1 Tax=Pelosinus fermentans B4 TaxID=1149862 RepID=I9B6E5_9FIRM|nr:MULTISPECIES: phage portal protein [Pelosinus]EIW20722.1 Bacteriophage portal protein, SPP1 Gp6-like protein [Pelosinus fermentans B4]EIW25433.1 hypothetical protein FA11_2592 [Pelosinus fermentans A11]OAM93693.1 Bacteriophage portal protein, SPP1 Gp6-like protein [Pelosinus fermentans DSM 17108]SDQ86806.1 Phage portal protein, SPP1 Gp6-like [Pelosinus fermentans]